MKVQTGPFTAHLICAGLYQRGKMHGMAPGLKAAGLRALGVARVVALAPKALDEDLERWAKAGQLPEDSQSSLPGSDNGEPLHFQYRHRPIPDGRLDESTAEFLLEEARLLAKKIRLGQCVLTACNAGRNRSGLLSALTVRELDRLGGAESLAIVRRERPRAVANPHFEKFLLNLGAPP